ncbi:MAG: serine protease [Pseudobdellovibrio sp.]
MKFLLTLTLLLAALNSQAQYIEKIIGDDDLIAVDATGSNIPERYRSIINAFGRMSMGCTATHIGNGYVLTAGHCFYAGAEPERDGECSDTTIEWGVREGVEPYLTSTCEKIIIAQQNETANDYALIKVSPIPPTAIAPELERRAIIGDSLTMFSHPEELPLRWSQACGIEREQHPDLPQGAFHHQCDTNPGSSGATILNLLTLKVIGIHDGGVVNGSGGMNYGTFIMNSPLFEELKKVGF